MIHLLLFLIAFPNLVVIPPGMCGWTGTDGVTKIIECPNSGCGDPWYDNYNCAGNSVYATAHSGTYSYTSGIGGSCTWGTASVQIQDCGSTSYCYDDGKAKPGNTASDVYCAAYTCTPNSVQLSSDGTQTRTCSSDGKSWGTWQTCSITQTGTTTLYKYGCSCTAQLYTNACTKATSTGDCSCTPPPAPDACASYVCESDIIPSLCIGTTYYPQTGCQESCTSQPYYSSTGVGSKPVCGACLASSTPRESQQCPQGQVCDSTQTKCVLTCTPGSTNKTDSSQWYIYDSVCSKIACGGDGQPVCSEGTCIANVYNKNGICRANACYGEVLHTQPNGCNAGKACNSNQQCAACGKANSIYCANTPQCFSTSGVDGNLLVKGEYCRKVCTNADGSAITPPGTQVPGFCDGANVCDGAGVCISCGWLNQPACGGICFFGVCGFQTCMTGFAAINGICKQSACLKSDSTPIPQGTIVDGCNGVCDGKGFCSPCGIEGQPACKVCLVGSFFCSQKCSTDTLTINDQGICTAVCGNDGQNICSDNTCNSGNNPDATSGKCVACGGKDQQACKGEPAPCEPALAVLNNICKECGSDGEPVCQDNSCNPGLVSTGGTCAVCGGDGQLACLNNLCNDGLVSVSGTCTACGDNNQPVCENNFCNSPFYSDGNGKCIACEKGFSYADGSCRECGSEGQKSCDGVCQENLVELNGVCSKCGELGQPVCSNGKCNIRSAVVDGICSQCGGDGQPICSDNTCSEFFDSVDAKTCTACGGRDQAVCVSKWNSKPCIEGYFPKDNVCKSSCVKSDASFEKESTQIGSCKLETACDGNGSCISCGDIGQITCSGICHVSASIKDNKCVECGGLNQPVCPDGTCQAGLVEK